MIKNAKYRYRGMRIKMGDMSAGAHRKGDKGGIHMDFFDKYIDLKARVAPFKTKEDFEYVKTTAAVDALADRADLIHRGAVPAGGVGYPEGLDEENLFNRALAYVEALERGELPLKGKFAEPGGAFVDHCFIEHAGRMHVFYNRSFIGYDWPERFGDTIGHAVSDDLLHWEIKRPAVTTQKGGIDSYQVWSPAVLAHNGEFWMFYTGVNKNVAQAVCLAKSKDLNSWQRYEENPIYIPGDWCPWDASHWSDCRDNMVFRDDDGTFYMYFCTSYKREDGTARGATGIIKSTDLYHWEDVDRFDFPSCRHVPESPFLIKHGGLYYFFYTNCGKGTAYAVSDNPVSGWQDMGLLIGDENHTGDTAHVPSCSEVFQFKGKWYISYATRIPGWEQYLQLKEFFWNSDGTVSTGNDITE